MEDVSRWDDQAASEDPYAELGYTASAGAREADRANHSKCQYKPAIRDANR